MGESVLRHYTIEDDGALTWCRLACCIELEITWEDVDKSARVEAFRQYMLLRESMPQAEAIEAIRTIAYALLLLADHEAHPEERTRRS